MTQDHIVELTEKHTNEKVLSISPIQRGAVNQIFIIKTIQKKYIFRTDLHENDTKRFKKEKWCTEAALKKSINTPQILTIGISHEYPYMIMEYIEGLEGDKLKEKKIIWEILGKYARQIHSIKIEGYGDHLISPGVFKDNWKRYLNYNISSLTTDDKVATLGAITKEESQFIKKVFLKIKETDFDFGLNHYDLALKNTILSSEDEVYLIDWGSANVAPVPHLDIAEILDSSLDEKSDEFKLFLKGYSLSYGEYIKLKPEIVALNLLVHLDKLRWAIDRNSKRIDHYTREVRAKLSSVQLCHTI